ncbi:hypothetical protein ACR47M_12510 [Stutzerimonas stutzeri]
MHAINSYRSCLLLAALAAGCTTPPAPSPVPDEVATPSQDVPFTRYGRYNLVELTPTVAQQDLLLQVVDVSIPDTLNANVADALRHVLQRSGYQLCNGRETDTLGSLPLPAAHYHLGPLQLRNALLALAGPARTLHVDHSARRVCFIQPFNKPADAPPATADTEPDVVGGVAAMTTMPGRGQHRLGTLLRAATITWLLLISAAVVIDHVALSGLAAQVETSTPSLQVDVLEERLAERVQQIEQAQQQPDALPQARYEAERQALEQRLDAIEQALGSRPTADNLLPLQARIEQLEMRLTAPRPTPPATTRPRVSAPAKPKIIEPPFRVIGVELRAGEQFLSILPSISDALSQVRLLRPGEAEAGWHLETIEANTAVFRYGEDTRRLPVPVQ